MGGPGGGPASGPGPLPSLARLVKKPKPPATDDEQQHIQNIINNTMTVDDFIGNIETHFYFRKPIIFILRMKFKNVFSKHNRNGAQGG
jgi:hypothetical protein